MAKKSSKKSMPKKASTKKTSAKKSMQSKTEPYLPGGTRRALRPEYGFMKEMNSAERRKGMQTGAMPGSSRRYGRNPGMER
jgi:hypothetical protein